MLARAKASPQGLSYGSTGVNTGQHLTMEMLKAATGANLVHIPYRGSAPAIVDLVAGQIPVASVDITSAYPHIVAGRAIALGMAEARRSARRAGNPDHRRVRGRWASAGPAASSACLRRAGTPARSGEAALGRSAPDPRLSRDRRPT